MSRMNFGPKPFIYPMPKPFYVEKAGNRITQQELQDATDRLMREIYAMEEA